MPTIQLLYLLASVAAVAAMAPQIKQLFVAKCSDELSFSAWVTWSTYQVMALLYAINIGAVPLIAANVAWVSFYAVMLTLMFRYRNNKRVAVTATVNE